MNSHSLNDRIAETQQRVFLLFNRLKGAFESEAHLVVIWKVDRDLFSFGEVDHPLSEGVVKKEPIYFDVESLTQIQRAPVPLGKVDLPLFGQEGGGKPLNRQFHAPGSNKPKLN